MSKYMSTTSLSSQDITLYCKQSGGGSNIWGHHRDIGSSSQCCVLKGLIADSKVNPDVLLLLIYLMNGKVKLQAPASGALPPSSAPSVGCQDLTESRRQTVRRKDK